MVFTPAISDDDTCAIYRLVEAEGNLDVVPLYVFLDVVNVMSIPKADLFSRYSSVGLESLMSVLFPKMDTRNVRHSSFL